MFADRIEFISIGGLLHGIELDDIMSGYSICRNPLLAGVLYRLQLVEAYGTGLQKIFGAYEGSGQEPKIEITPNVFKITLPNVNAVSAKERASEPASSPEESIMSLAQEKGKITRKDVEELLEVSQTLAGQLLRELVKRGLLIKEGNGRNTKYSS